MRIAAFALLPVLAFGQPSQQVEGYAATVFSPSAGGRQGTPLDFRGPVPGSMTAAWWAPGQQAKNWVEWKTAAAPSKQGTVFSFIGSSAVTPGELSRGPQARLSVDGTEALTFDLGVTADRTWSGNGFVLRYESRRAEWPFAASHRQFEMNGQSGIYRLRVPASRITAGQPVTLKVAMLPFERWNNGWFMVKHRKDVLAADSAAMASEIKQLQRDVRWLQESLYALASSEYSKLLDSHGAEHRVIHTNGYRHLHPADIIALQNGDLLLTAREGTEHISRDGDVIMLRSKDGGMTWGDRRVIAAMKDVDEREGCGIQLRDGTIVVGVYFNNLYKEDGEYDWSNRDHRVFYEGKKTLGAYFITSTDNGYTWSAPNFIDMKGMPFTDLEGPADAPVELPDGSILLPMMAYNVQGDAKNMAGVMMRSADKGKTWQYLSTMANDPGGKLGNFAEPGLVRTKSGRLIVAMRNHAPENAIWTTYSDDEGKTWAPVKRSPMIGHPADLIQLADGRILCTYGVRTNRHADPAGIRATFSEDNGETWKIADEVILRRDFLNFDIGYPESRQMPDGRIMTVYYFNMFGRYFLGQTIWKP